MPGSSVVWRRWPGRCTVVRFMLVALALLSGSAEAVAPAAAQAIPGLVPAPSAASAPAAAPTEADTAAISMVAPTEMIDTAMTVRARLYEIFGGAPRFPAEVAATFAAADGTGSVGWLVGAVVVTLLAVALGLLAMRAFRRWTAGYLRQVYGAVPKDRAERVGFFLVKTLIAWTGVVVFAAVGGLVLIAAAGHHMAGRETGITAIFVISIYLWARGLFESLLAPADPPHRVVPFPDEDARRLFGALMTALAVAGAAFAFGRWIEALGAPEDAARFAHILSSIVSGFALAAVALLFRREIGAAIRGPGRSRLWRRLLGSTWHVLVVAYLAAATIANVGAIAHTGEQLGGTILGPTFALVAGFGLYAVLVILIDRRFRARQRALGASEAEIEAGVVAGEAAETGRSVEIVGTDADEVRRIAWATKWKALFEHVAGIVSLFAGLLVLLANWHLLDLGEGRLIARFSGLGFVILACYVAYQAVKVWIDGKLEEETPAAHAGEHADEGMGAGTSRLGTILPILRTTLLVTIVSVAAMVILAGLGVNIAPLFAGAGIVGLAIGFGSQTLIRDVFSGAFFLIDDAFRKGEYIEIGNIRGAVERINVRSLQLRHQNGPLHTIPFGEIRQLTNYSRDWVIMKLPMRLTYDTDVEKVRKIVKKVGEQLAADPEIGRYFVSPPKSQGVVEMDDSAMIIRVKFMTKPGDQFLVRRHVYQRIQKAFDENDIHFASRQVVVRIADDNPSEDPDERERRRQAAVGAVQPLLEQAGKAR